MTARISARHLAPCLAIVVASVALARPASADTPLQQAKVLTSRATIEFKVGHFESALDLYSKAYELVPTPALLFDVGQCHRMLKNYERAIFFFQEYLREKAGASNRPVVEQLLDDSKRQLQEQRSAEAASKASTEAERHAAEPQPPPPPEVPAPSPASVPQAVETTPRADHPGIRVAGLATTGVGLVLVGAATYFGLRASSLSNEISQVSSGHGTWSPQDQSDYDAGKSDARWATILYVAGGVTLAAGGVLTYLGWPRKGGEGHVTATVVPAPSGASVTVVGRF
jgi:tetratricopeptide (TPR) repeat protein